MGLVQKLFFGTPLGWYTDGDISVENCDAAIRWLEDRSRFSTWLTSIVSGGMCLTGLPRSTVAELFNAGDYQADWSEPDAAVYSNQYHFHLVDIQLQAQYRFEKG